MKPSSPCWVWKGSRSAGYGMINRKAFGPKPTQAHRVVYEMLVGPIPEGMTLDHLCENPPCVNPSHLKVATLWENVGRSNAPPAVNARKTHCKNGHALEGENLQTGKLRGRPIRKCRICTNVGRLRFYYRHREAISAKNSARKRAKRRAEKKGGL